MQDEERDALSSVPNTLSLEQTLMGLSVADLVRLRRRYCKHDCTIQRKEYLAQTIAHRAGEMNTSDCERLATGRCSAAWSALEKRHSKCASGTTALAALGSRKAEVCVAPPSAAFAVVSRRSDAEANGDGGGGGRLRQIPTYMRGIGLSRTKWFDGCVRDLGIVISAPTGTVELRRRFLAHPRENFAVFVELCAKSSERLFTRYKAQLCRKLAVTSGGSHRQRPATASVRTPREPKDESLAAKRLDVQRAALAEWKLRRFVEQGPGYLHAVWPKLKKDHLDLEYSGMWWVPSAESVRLSARRREAHAARMRRLCALARAEKPETAASKEGPRAAGGSEGVDEHNDDDDEGDEGDDAGDATEDSAAGAAPHASLLITPANTLEIKVSLSEEQAVKAVAASGEDNGAAASSSGFLFRTEVACIRHDADAGMDTWIGISGLWKNQLIFFIRDDDGNLDSFVGDHIFFEKRVAECSGSDSDPFKCSHCGNVRRGNNYVYVRPSTSEICRGRYFCVICGKKTLHLRADRRTRRPQPPWCSTLSRSQLPTSTLSEPPFTGLRPSMYM